MAVPSPVCSSCGAANPEGARFCASCGTSMATGCPNCGTAVVGRFCHECGTAVDSGAASAVVAAPVSQAAPVAERRVTSVLFADLVGFTPLSESRDSEDVRELLSRYFAVARTVIARFGGTVEKFIGDAVMAVWGVPTAQEDDAERAVRAGLDLINAVTALGEEIGIPELAMRAGIVTGEVAVTLGATGEGMVAGDAVNTAARVQSAAVPNEVWVDDTTRRLTSAGIAYTDCGAHELKGKSEPMTLYAARQTVGSVGGALRVDGLEAPFVGRDRDMRLVKELFHATMEEGRPRLVAVTGLPGVGKSRLGWEFFKYIDGLTSTVRWHRGRCLSYGEGIAFHALAEMVRSRVGALEGDEPAAVATKLDAGLQQWVTDPEERRWISPRLAVLLGGDVATSATYPREDLFAAWQVFFERLVVDDATGVALLIEDLQWADDGLLDFIDHLTARSQCPIFILALARPELDDRRPGWSSGRRGTPLHLEPLTDGPMARLVDGLVDGMSQPLRDALVSRSEGIPLYAVETVRSLIDRDVVVPQDGRYVVAAGAEPNLEEGAPTSLHTLIAARLDTLSPEERRVVQNASVLGLSFPRAGIAALSGVDGDLDAALDDLMRKEILSLDSDPRSPERGQYRFVQAMVRTVAYETLSRRDRKARHLLAAEHLSGEADSDLYAAVIASHYLDATVAEPNAEDSGELAERGIAMLETAAARAASLGTPAQARRHHERALEFTSDNETRARLGVGAAAFAITAGDMRGAEELANAALAAAEDVNNQLLAAQALTWLATALNNLGIGHDLPDRLIRAYNELAAAPETMEVRSRLAHQISRAYFSSLADLDHATHWADISIGLAEAAENWPHLADLLAGYGSILMSSGRPTMALGVIRVALDLAREHHLAQAELTPLNNLASFLASRDLVAARKYADEGLALAQRLGDRDLGAYLLGTAAAIYCLSGAWEELVELGSDSSENRPLDMGSVLDMYAMLVRLARGESIDESATDDEKEYGPQIQTARLSMRALSAWSRGDVEQAVSLIARGTELFYTSMGVDDDFPVYWSTLMDFAVTSGRREVAEHWLQRVVDMPRGRQPYLIRALVPYFRARLREGDRHLVDGDYAEAIEGLRAYGAPYWLARCLLEHAEFLTETNQVEVTPALLDEAEQIFTTLRATPWIERSRRARALAVR